MQSIMSSHNDEYRQWPFLTQEEFELSCAFFDQRYVRASLGPTRQVFKIRSRRTATTGSSYIEILRLLQLPEDVEELSLALAKLGKGSGDLGSGNDVEMDTTEEDADEVSEVKCYRERWA
jgi:ubiquitin-like-conjugating enzyme ATG10